jgi:hypothetical protein
MTYKRTSTMDTKESGTSSLWALIAISIIPTFIFMALVVFIGSSKL